MPGGSWTTSTVVLKGRMTMVAEQTNWRFESPKGAKIVRIYKDGSLYATWSAIDGLSEVPLALPEQIKIALAEGAARFHVNGAEGVWKYFGGEALPVRH
jgi:hypothetical protein